MKFEGKKHFFTPFEGKKQFFTSNEGNPFHVTLLVSPTSEKGWHGSEEKYIFSKSRITFSILEKNLFEFLCSLKI